MIAAFIRITKAISPPQVFCDVSLIHNLRPTREKSFDHLKMTISLDDLSTAFFLNLKLA